MTPFQSYRFGPATKIGAHSSREQTRETQPHGNRNLEKCVTRISYKVAISRFPHCCHRQSSQPYSSDAKCRRFLPHGHFNPQSLGNLNSQTSPRPFAKSLCGSKKLQRSVRRSVLSNQTLIDNRTNFWQTVYEMGDTRRTLHNLCNQLSILSSIFMMSFLKKRIFPPSDLTLKSTLSLHRFHPKHATNRGR